MTARRGSGGQGRLPPGVRARDFARALAAKYHGNPPAEPEQRSDPG